MAAAQICSVQDVAVCTAAVNRMFAFYAGKAKRAAEFLPEVEAIVDAKVNAETLLRFAQQDVAAGKPEAAAKVNAALWLYRSVALRADNFLRVMQLAVAEHAWGLGAYILGGVVGLGVLVGIIAAVRNRRN